MFSKITGDIKVSVEPIYDSKNSFPAENRYVFKYNILIENNSSTAVKILKRKWLIFDVGFGFTEVVGDGVIGLTPDILPGDHFAYFSNVILRSGVGNMSGKYLVEDQDNKSTFEIEIPKFDLVSHVLSN